MPAERHTSQVLQCVSIDAPFYRVERDRVKRWRTHKGPRRRDQWDAPASLKLPPRISLCKRYLKTLSGCIRRISEFNTTIHSQSTPCVETQLFPHTASFAIQNPMGFNNSMDGAFPRRFCVPIHKHFCQSKCVHEEQHDQIRQSSSRSACLRYRQYFLAFAHVIV